MPPRRVCIFGEAESGKTTLGARLIAGLPIAHVWVHDPAGKPYLRVYRKCDEYIVPPLNDVVLLLDEIDMLAPVGGWCGERITVTHEGTTVRNKPWTEVVIKIGRNWNVSWIAISQRPSNVRRDVTSNARELYLGRLTESCDLSRVVKDWGERCLKVRDLPPGKFLYFKK